MQDPLVSVLIPVYDGERFLAEAIESVLGQTWERVEAIVVDDGSHDRSAEIAASYPVTLIRQENAGVAAARNRGLEEAAGELVAFIDQDDVWLPRKLERQVAALRAEPGAGICIGAQQIFLEPGYDGPPAMPREWLDGWHLTTQLGGVLVWREVFDEVGGFDSAYQAINDTDWVLRAFDAGVGLVLVEDGLQRYRLHGDNTSARIGGLRRELVHVVHASIKRKRAAVAG